MLFVVPHNKHSLNRLVLVNLLYQVCCKIFSVGVRFTLILYWCTVGRDLGANSRRPVSGSSRRGPKRLKAPLAEFNLYFLARVFARESLAKIQIRFRPLTLFAANV